MGTFCPNPKSICKKILKKLKKICKKFAKILQKIYTEENFFCVFCNFFAIFLQSFFNFFKIFFSKNVQKFFQKKKRTRGHESITQQPHLENSKPEEY